jgi:chromosome segregation ATPase
MTKKTEMTKEQLQIANNAWKIRCAELEEEVKKLQDNCTTYSSKVTHLEKRNEEIQKMYDNLFKREAQERSYLVKLMKVNKTYIDIALGE